MTRRFRDLGATWFFLVTLFTAPAMAGHLLGGGGHDEPRRPAPGPGSPIVIQP